jgi:hypothetical protein
MRPLFVKRVCSSVAAHSSHELAVAQARVSRGRRQAHANSESSASSMSDDGICDRESAAALDSDAVPEARIHFHLTTGPSRISAVGASSVATR